MSEIDFYIDNDFKGHVSTSALLQSEGTIMFAAFKDNLKVNTHLFGINDNKGFKFVAVVQNAKVIVERCGSVVSLALDGILSTINPIRNNPIRIFIVWAPTEIILYASVTGRKRLAINSQVRTTISIASPNISTTPPELIRWARKQLLLPKRNYNTEEDFRLIVYSSLLLRHN